MRSRKSFAASLLIGALTAACIMGTFAPVASAEFTVLASFSGGAGDGAGPRGPLVRSGSTLFGATSAGGVDNKGTIFKINTDGTGKEVLLSFGSVGYSGSIGGLVLDDSVLYGVIYNSSYEYKLFKINTNGTGFAVLYSFTVAPTGFLTLYEDLSNTYLYGLTTTGGDHSKGTVFRIKTSGADYETLYSFAGGATDGDKPVGALTLSGTTFYGVTLRGGSDDFGALFKIDAVGSPYQCLYSFQGSLSDRAGPNGFLTLSGSILYGMTAADSTGNPATIYRINTDGAGFQTLYTFSWSEFWTIDGPYCPLVVAGPRLYGGNPESGDRGTVFKVNTDGTGYETMHAFAGGTTDGAMSTLNDGFLLLSGSTLYGTTWMGGANNTGILYSITVPGVDNPAIYPLLMQ